MLDAATVATDLRTARRRAGLTQRQLAERAGTSQAAVARYERGRTVPDVATLARLLAAAGYALRAEPLEPAVDEHDWSLVEESLRLTPEQRLDRLVRTVAFVRAGRAAVAAARA